MKQWFLRLSAAFLMFGACVSANAQDLTKNQKDVLNLVRRMYEVSSHTFEAGEFDGKFQPKKHCLFLSQFLAKEALIKDKQGACEGQFRYPTASSEVIYQYPNLLPVPQLGTPVIKGDRAEIKVLFLSYDKKHKDGGRCLYFLKKLP